jgi:lipoprotein signal peptidase
MACELVGCVVLSGPTANPADDAHAIALPLRYLYVMRMLCFQDVPYFLSRILMPANAPVAGLVVRRSSAEQRERTKRGVLVFALIAAVVLLDQTAKWWAWRHFPWAVINSGGDILVGSAIGAWYANPVTGALLDLLSVGLLGIAIAVLARSQAPAAVRIPGALMLGGWGSNVLDRLGLHYWTAPGSIRGVVDFIHLGGYYYNVADFFIISCTPLFLLAIGYRGVRAAMGLAAARRVAPAAPLVRGRVHSRVPNGRVQTGILALVGAGLVMAVALGAAHYGGVNAASCLPAQRGDGQPTVAASTAQLC